MRAEAERTLQRPACPRLRRDIGALRDPDKWEAWLHRLTVRACYRAAKKERRRSTVELHVVAEPRPDPGSHFSLSVEERDRMERELGRLTVDQRAVMVLHFYADLTLQQAADVLEIPVGTAKSRLHYGLRALRESMADTVAFKPTGEQVA